MLGNRGRGEGKTERRREAYLFLRDVNLINRQLGGWFRETNDSRFNFILMKTGGNILALSELKSKHQHKSLCQQISSFSAPFSPQLLQGKRKLKDLLCSILSHKAIWLLPEELLAIFPRNTLYKQWTYSPLLPCLPLSQPPVPVLVLMANETKGKEEHTGGKKVTICSLSKLNLSNMTLLMEIFPTY